MTRFDGDVHMVGVVIAVDGVLGDQGLRQVQRLDGQIKQAARVGVADFGRQRLLSHGQAENGLAAAAARGAVTDGVRFEQGDAVAALRQVQCSRAAGDTAAQHHHIGAMLAAQRFAMCARVARRKVAEVQRRLRSTRGRVDRIGARRSLGQSV